MLLLIERRIDERREVQQDKGHPRHRIEGLLEAKVEKQRIEVMC